MTEPVRIHKALADAGVASRRAAESLVAAGRVTVNGAPANVGQRVDPTVDVLTVDGRVVAGRPEPVYLVLNKPAGVTSTVRDRHAARTVVDLVPAEVRRRAARIYPVGRLDRDSEGLLLLTNDGSWAQRMLHPRYRIEREYAVGLAVPLAAEQRRRLDEGVVLDEGPAALTRLRSVGAADVRQQAPWLGSTAESLAWYRVVVEQGWRRQIRRMFGAVGAPVERLVRVRFGTLHLERMAPGDVRPLGEAERQALESSAAREQGPRGEGERRLVVSIDGPGGSGKSSVGGRAAARLGYRFADTGVLYRGLTWLALERGVDPDDADALVRLVDELALAADDNQRYVRLVAGGRDVTDELHTPQVDRTVSRVSRHAAVRSALVPVQRRLAESGGIIMAGRDIGSVILPDADVKIYLDVSVEERARRRAQERGLAGDTEAVRATEAELRRRDVMDSTRPTAPLRVPQGATVVNTEGNTLEQTVDAVVAAIRGHGSAAAGAAS